MPSLPHGSPIDRSSGTSLARTLHSTHVILRGNVDADVGTRTFGHEPTVVEHLVEELGVLDIAEQRSVSYHRLPAIGQPSVGADRMRQWPFVLTAEPTGIRRDVGQNPTGLILMSIDADELYQPPAVMPLVDLDRPNPQTSVGPGDNLYFVGVEDSSLRWRSLACTLQSS